MGQFTRKKDSKKLEKEDKKEKKISVSTRTFIFGVSKFKCALLLLFKSELFFHITAISNEATLILCLKEIW